jgi:O-antigen/teichoic acid export membrane protein
MSVLKKNLIFNTLLSLSQILFPLVTFPYVSRILGPGGIGQVSFVDSITQYFILFSAVGIPLYGVRELSKLRKDAYASSKLFSELIILHFLTSAVFLLVYVITILLLNNKGIPNNLFLIGCGMLMSNVFLVEWYYQSQEKFDYITKRTIFLRFIFIGLMFFMVRDKSDNTNYYLLSLILQLTNAGINFFLVFKSDIKLVFTGLNLKKHIKPLLFLTACSVIGSVYVLLDNVILGILSTPQSVGYYSSAVKITKVPISLINALGIVLVPKLSESFSNEDFKMVKYYIDSSMHYVLTFGVPLAIGIALTAKWTVLLVSGAEFFPAILLVRYLSPIVVLIALNCIFFFQLFTPGNKERTMIIILLVSALISIVLNLILIPRFQHLGTAITTTVTELSVFLVSLYFSKKLFNIGLDFKLLIKPIIASLVFVPIIMGIDHCNLNTGMKLIVGAGSCMIVYYGIQSFIFKDTIMARMQEFVLSALKIKTDKDGN